MLRKVCAWVDRAYGRERGRWAAAFIFSLLLLLLMRALQPVTFYDNDDLNIAWALAGYRSGTPSFSHPFLNCITAAIVSLLYTLFPRVAWWLAVQTVGLLCGMTAFGASLTKVCFRRGLPATVPLGLFALSGAALFFYPVSLVTFTLTSSVLGLGAVSLCIAADRADAPGTFRAYLSLGAAMLAGSFLVRQSAGLCAACFYAGALVYRMADAYLAADRRAIKRVWITAGIAALAAATLTAANGVGRSALQPDGFLTFEEARASYMDYPHDSYQDDPALYTSVGWDGTLASLADAWFYMDERVDAERLNTIVEGSAFARMTFSERLRAGWQVFTEFLGKYPLAQYWCMLSIGVCAALLLAFLLSGKRAWLPAAVGVCLFIGAAFLTAFLCVQGRMNLRTLMTALYPWMAAGTLLTVLAFPEGGEGRRRTLGGAALLMLCGAMLYPCYKIARTVYSYKSGEQLAIARGLASYVMAHPDGVYIRDVYAANSFDATSVYPEAKPTNLMDWGGCDMYSSARVAQMEKNGLTSPYADVFLQGNVYYVCDKDGAYLPLLDEYMRSVRGASGYRVEGELAGGVLVVQFYR